jgi:alpha-D-ribose 1-methylphosphonate 5-triphosphate diphosphatase PhnM
LPVCSFLHGLAARETFGAEAVGVTTVLDGVLLGDVAVGDECLKAVIDGVASFLTADLHEADHLFDLAFTETGLNP